MINRGNRFSWHANARRWVLQAPILYALSLRRATSPFGNDRVSSAVRSYFIRVGSYQRGGGR